MGILDSVKKEVKEEMEEAKKLVVEVEEKAKESIVSVEKEAEQEKVGIIDVLSEKVLSRKLLVWITASVFLGFEKITPDEWMGISLGYIGIQGIADLASKWKGAGK